MTDKVRKGPDYMWRPYRWFMLVLIALIQISTNFCNIQISALAGNVIQELGLTTAQFGAVASCSFLGGAIFGFICGPLGDKYGVKHVITIAGIISVLGAVWRLFAVSFFTLFASMFIIGIVMAALNANSAKIINMWFAPSQAAFAMSIYIACSTVGAVLALSTTPALMAAGYSIRSIYVVGMVTVIIAMVLWILFGKVKPEGAPDITSEPVMKYLKNVIGNGKLWINSISMFLMMGAFISCSTYMVLEITTIKGGSAAQAGLVSSLSAIIAVPLMLIIPAIISKTGYIRGGLIVLLLLGAALLAISWVMPWGVPAIAVMMLGISFIGNGIPLMKQFPAYIPGIPQDSIGTAGGIQATCQNLGAFLVPSYMIGAIAGANISSIFAYLIPITVVIAAVLMFFVPEIGAKAKAAQTESAE